MLTSARHPQAVYLPAMQLRGFCCVNLHKLTRAFGESADIVLIDLESEPTSSLNRHAKRLTSQDLYIAYPTI